MPRAGIDRAESCEGSIELQLEALTAMGGAARGMQAARGPQEPRGAARRQCVRRPRGYAAAIERYHAEIERERQGEARSQGETRGERRGETCAGQGETCGQGEGSEAPSQDQSGADLESWRVVPSPSDDGSQHASQRASQPDSQHLKARSRSLPPLRRVAGPEWDTIGYMPCRAGTPTREAGHVAVAGQVSWEDGEAVLRRECGVRLFH